MEMEKYFHELEGNVKHEYAVAGAAREKGFDPMDKVEVLLATNLAEKTLGLISTIYPQLNDKKIVNRILELEKEYGPLDTAVSFKIAEEIAKEKFCKFESLLQAIEAGIRVGFAYTTLGVVSSPIEGFTALKIEKTRDGKEYFKAYFSGPIRSAGTTASCVVLMLIDYLREKFGFAKYDPDELEIKRYVTEIYDYHERVTNLQYLPTEEEALFLAKNLPIQIAGEPTEKREVSNFKDLPRVETNFIRGGMCLIFSEGLAQKAQKGLRLLKGVQAKGFKSTGWNFLDEYLVIHKKREKGTTDTSPTYIKDLVAGRPVFSHPSRSGGFRFRYGKSRVSGFSATSIHPATMAISNCFLSTGTQLKTEKPTKGCVITSCDSIDGPIVKLKNGSTRKLSDFEEAKKFYKDVEEIIYIGDILYSLGDVMNRNYELLKPGYVEEWWELELKKAAAIGEEDEEKKKEKFSSLNVEKYHVSLDQAVSLSNTFKVPLHPKYIFYWSQINVDDFFSLIEWIKSGVLGDDKLILPYNRVEKDKFKVGKRALEILGVEHDVTIENVVLSKEESRAILINLGIEKKDFDDKFMSYSRKIENIKEKETKVLALINNLSKFKIKDKAGTFIGARMGRPEKAKPRELKGSPHVLFPVGEEGGKLRSFQAAIEKGSVRADFPIYFCDTCNKETVYFICETCGSKARKMNYCNLCGKKSFSEGCNVHGKMKPYMERRINIGDYYKIAMKKADIQNILKIVKGVRGTSSESHIPENIIKGILRANFGLHVNKDGTIRYDVTELPITHFKPKEIGTSIEKLRELGYNVDIGGKKLENDNQILELKPHDIVLPSCPDSDDEKADHMFINATKFIDALLVKLYGQKEFYNVRTKEDLIGKLTVTMAPHNCAGVVTRIIGFSKVQGIIASPYLHAAVRRDCFDYDTYLPLKENGIWRIVKVGEFVENLNPDKIVDKYGTKEKKVEGFKTIGLNKNISEVKINNFTKHLKMPLIEIKTHLGKKVSVTGSHKFLVEGEIVRAEELKIGDRLPLPKKIEIESKDIKEINLLEELKEEKVMVRNVNGIIKQLKIVERDKILRELGITKRQFQNFNIRSSYPINFILKLNKDMLEKICCEGKLAVKRDNIEVPIILKISDELLEVIGLYVAEGYSRCIEGKKGLNQVYIASNDIKIRNFVKKIMKKSFGLVPSERKKDRVTFSSKILYWFFTKILETGSNAKNKRIPPLFLNLGLERLAYVLRGYFEGDGSVSASDRRVSCDSVSEGLLADLEFCLLRYGIFVKRYEYKKEPGPRVRTFYFKKGRKIPKFKIIKLIIGSDFVDKFKKIGFLSNKKNKILNICLKKKKLGMKIEQDSDFVHDSIVSINRSEEKESYCLNVDNKNHLIVANSILTRQCDGDEVAVMLLLDVLLNFSRKFLPAHRGGTQDAPLVLNARIRPGEVDDQILDLELSEYPLEMYELAEKGEHSSKVIVDNVKRRLREGKDPLINTLSTHDTDDFNHGVVNSSYKSIPSMHEKVDKQMELVQKIRAVDEADIARLIIERHFIRDIKGNFNKFTQQQFRCVDCNEIYRRPPLSGKCIRIKNDESICGGKIIFTIAEGSIMKYLETATNLAKNYDVPAYTKQSLDLARWSIESMFGKQTEKQQALGKFF